MPKVHLYNWMEALKPDKTLVELCLPGSHDAGVYEDKARNVTPGASARCQYANIREQAGVGSRAFDIRCFMDGNTPRMGHFFKDTPSPLGDWGGTLESALDDAGVFLAAFPSEFLIFRIGHTDCVNEVAAVLEKFRNADTSEKFHNPKYGPTGKTNAALIHRSTRGSVLVDQRVKQLKGKLVLLCDNENLQSANFTAGKGYYLYDKYSTSPSNAHIRFCGKYGGSPLKTSTGGKGNWSAEGAVHNAEEAFLEHQTHKQPKPDHLWWVYWQETGGNVLANTSATKGMHNRLENFLSKFKLDISLPRPNVIGQDFVEKFTCAAIVKMNVLAFQQDWVLDTYGF